MEKAAKFLFCHPSRYGNWIQWGLSYLLHRDLAIMNSSKDSNGRVCTHNNLLFLGIAAKKIRSGELFRKNSNVRWRFWLSILLQIYRPSYVRTARRYSDVMEFTGMEWNLKTG
jgi:hypothetical protein